MAKSNAEKVAESEARKKEKGLRKTSFWCYPEDREKIRAYIQKLIKRRGQ